MRVKLDENLPARLVTVPVRFRGKGDRLRSRDYPVFTLESFVSLIFWSGSHTKR